MSQQRHRLVRPVLIVVFIALAALLVWRFGRETPREPSPTPNATPSAQPKRAHAPRVPDRPGPLRMPGGEVGFDSNRLWGAFSGHVVSARNGAPIPGATLTFEYDGVAHTVTSGADGAFLFEPPKQRGMFTLAMVTAKGFHPFAPAWGESPIKLVAAPGYVVRGLTITLEPERKYQGVVLTSAGEPAPRAEVRILDAPGDTSAGGRFVADEKGAFSFSAPDDALLEATHPDHGPARARLDMRAQASGRVTLRLRPKGEAFVVASITGTVVDAAGAPVAFASVSARFRGEAVARGSDEFHPGGHATTDERGAFTLEGLDAGSYELTAREGARIARVEGVAAGAEGVTLRLDAAGRIVGEVWGAAPVERVSAFSVVAARHRGPVEREYAASASFFHSFGSFELEGLLPGTYDVTAAAIGHAPSDTVIVTVPPGGEVTANLRLNTGGRLHGVVVEEGNQSPIEGARVTIEGLLGANTGPVPVVAETTTDASGRFTIMGLAAGPRSVAATAPGHHGRIVSGLLVTEGGESGLITISLAKLEEGEEPRMELTGIGAVLSPKGDALVVGQVLPGGGAATAGLGPGDAILAIDGATVVELGFDGAVQRIRGPEGSVVKLSVRRGGEGEAVEVSVRRTRIRG